MPPRVEAVLEDTGAASPEPLEIDDVTVRFGGLTALDAVSLRVGSGEVVGVIGPNGAGKTTLFNAICGFVRPESGEIRWRGRSLRGVRTHRLAGLGIARTLQGVGLFSGLTVLENVLAGADARRRSGFLSSLLGLPRSDRDERSLRAHALESLKRVGAGAIADRLPETIPYAEQKRAALARALAGAPELLMLDEPAGGLSSDEIAELADLIRELRGSITVMIVEHRMDFVLGLCDRVVVLDFGRLIASGAPDQVRENPEVLEAYLGAEPGEADAEGTDDA